ncbi:zinc-dependent metalloprotease [Cellulomonas aerilata]|uniref:Hydrolase n=1 Tax=Cellulomonas aerilata TaxID=515326 RepID=A0A512DEK8_9CELL|nr:zinc-dependent metalloprotease [Cellulomonas aerilata]GEO34895.1 hypothetical protein CAE01nite_26200 [Cellulomonas aerilata]
MRTSAATASGLPVDWDVAAQVAARLVRPGRAGGRQEMTDLVADLRRAAAQATGHVVEVTGMTPADGRPSVDVSQVVVVDRTGWARANTEMLESLTRGVTLPAGGRPASAAARSAGALQVGGVLSLLAGRVLGQFDPFTRSGPEDGRPGRLLLVAPNVARMERELHLDGRDFRLWVALHEQTHALQFAAAPWLEEHLRSRLRLLLTGLADADGPLTGDGAIAVATGLARAVRGRDGGSGPEVLLPPDERRLFDEVGAVMALLEGHADVAMDAVGRTVVPSLRQIRARFERRRSTDRGAADRVLRRVLGMDLKLAQYRDGAAFVRRVRRRVGQDGLNAVWSRPDHLPTAAEIADPTAWVRRVHG